MDRCRDRCALACVLVVLLFLGPLQPVHAAAAADVAELNLVEELVIGATGSTTSDGLFGEIIGVAVDSRGFLHVLDPGFGCIWKFSSSGQLQLRYGAEGAGPGEFRNPQAIAVGPGDRIYVCGHSSLVTVFEADGKAVASHRRDSATMGEPSRSLVVDPRNRVSVCSVDVREHTVIFQYDPVEFSLIRSFGDSYAAGHDVDPRAERTFGGGHLALAAAGDELLYVQSAPPLVRRHDLDGGLLGTIAVRGSDTGLPRSEAEGDRFTVHAPDMVATAILGLGDGTIIVAVADPLPAAERSRRTGFEGTMILERYDRSGRLLSSTTRDRVFRPVCRTSRDRIYVSEYRDVDGYECPVIVRYRVE